MWNEEAGKNRPGSHKRSELGLMGLLRTVTYLKVFSQGF